MDVITLVFIISGIIWLWLTAIAVFAAKHDQTLNPFQKKAQIIIAIVIPVVGAALVLYLVQQHSPEAIPRSWAPWPFRSMIFGKPRPLNRNRNDNQGPGEDLALSHRSRSHHDNDFGGGGSTDGGSD